MNDRLHLIDVYTRIIRLCICFFFFFSHDARSRATQYSYLTIILSLSSSNNPNQILSLLRIYLTGSNRWRECLEELKDLGWTTGFDELDVRAPREHDFNEIHFTVYTSLKIYKKWTKINQNESKFL